MKIHRETIVVHSQTQIEFVDITDDVHECIKKSGIRDGSVLIYAPHTTMGICINHNEPMLLQDFMRVLYKMAPVDDQYSHDLFELRRDQSADGRSNGHSHCKALLLGTSETIPVVKGAAMLTDIQSVFAVELDGGRKRDIVIQVSGD